MTTMTAMTAMKRRPSAWRWAGWLLLIGLFVAVMGTLVTLAALFNELPADLLITIDGEQIDLHGVAASHVWLVFGTAILAIVAVVVVVPIALLFGVGVPLLLAGFGVLIALVCAAATAALAGSPLILLGLLVWWAVRPKKAAPGGGGKAAATSAPAAPPPVPVIGQHTDNSTPFA